MGFSWKKALYGLTVYSVIVFLVRAVTNAWMKRFNAELEQMQEELKTGKDLQSLLGTYLTEERDLDETQEWHFPSDYLNDVHAPLCESGEVECDELMVPEPWNHFPVEMIPSEIIEKFNDPEVIKKYSRKERKQQERELGLGILEGTPYAAYVERQDRIKDQIEIRENLTPGEGSRRGIDEAMTRVDEHADCYAMHRVGYGSSTCLVDPESPEKCLHYALHDVTAP